MVAEPGYTSRELDANNVARVAARLPMLMGALRAAMAAPTVESIAAVVDAARWVRLDVDTALAMKKHIADAADGNWASLRFTSSTAARATFAAFVEAPVAELGLVQMWNLRARLEGLLHVARGYHAELAGT